MSESQIDAAGELLGDPAQLAQYQFQLAQQLCGACRNYHAIWPYRRLARIIIGLEADAPILEPILREAAQPNGRILIAGAADAGLLALTERVTRGLSPLITVADRCQTPLSVCRRYADSRHISVVTLKTDLAIEQLHGRYDTIFAHGFLRFVPETARTEFFRSLRASLAPAGQLVVAEMLPRPLGNPSRDRSYVDDLLTVLKANGISLPEDESLFRSRLQIDVNALRTRLSSALGEGDLPRFLTEAGLMVRHCVKYERQGTAAIPNVGLLSVTSQVAVASGS